MWILEFGWCPGYQGFPGGSDGKEPACNVGDLGSTRGLGRSPVGGHGNPLQCSFLGNPHVQRRLVGCSPWGYKESDMTEWLSTAPGCDGCFIKSDSGHSSTHFQNYSRGNFHWTFPGFSFLEDVKFLKKPFLENVSVWNSKGSTFGNFLLSFSLLKVYFNLQWSLRAVLKL